MPASGPKTIRAPEPPAAEKTPCARISLANYRKVPKLHVNHLSHVKRSALTLLASALLASQTFAATVTNIIDPFTTVQLISTNNATVTNTVAATSIGGFRTLILSTSGGDPLFGSTILGVDDTSQQLILNTPAAATPSFQVIWGGEGGTNGLGGVAFGGGQPLDLFTSVLSFSLGSTDQPNDFTWSFTDTNNNTATYTSTFPVHSSGDAPLPFNITLDSFANATNIDWNAIDIISFSGGNASGVDMTAIAPFQVVASTVPEPGTWALLASGLAVTALVLRRRSRRSC
jgi:hypothetical protein